MFVVRGGSHPDHVSVRKFSFSWMKETFTLFWTYELILKRYEGRVVDGHWSGRYLTLSISLNPRRWRLGIEHLWYDGPHCGYFVGPFTVAHSLNSRCKKCLQ